MMLPAVCRCCALCSPVFVTHYPRRIKPFYMKTDDTSLQDGPERETVLCLDLLVPGVGELMGGSEREDRYERLEQNMTAAGLDVAAYQWYLDLRKSAHSLLLNHRLPAL